MKVSASPKPASGPVLGLTCPILMTRLWAYSGVVRNTAGAPRTPMPAPISLRRETPACDEVSLFPMGLSYSPERTAGSTHPGFRCAHPAYDSHSLSLANNPLSRQT